MQTSLAIGAPEFAERRARLVAYLHEHGLTGGVLYDNYYILYYSGFAFVPTERPMAFLINADGDAALYVPRLELEHAQAKSRFERIYHYVEYPYEPHPAYLLKDALADLGVRGAIGADADGYPWIFGYRGPSLSETTGSRVQIITGAIDDQLAIKSPAEIALIRESARWGNLAHRLLQRYTTVGRAESEVSMRASHEATLALYDTLGQLYSAQSTYGEGASATYRGQIGRNAAIPHTLSNNIVFRRGDVLVTGAGAPFFGYNSELERTMVIGEPSDEQRRMFTHMKAAQEVALEALRPGARCSDIDRAVRAYYDRHDLMQYWKHHTGHAIGLRYHEGPFLDLGDRTEIRPGMVFTVEPGLYAANLGGFRHSDTVVVTADGTEQLTYYPRDLDSLTLPA